MGLCTSNPIVTLRPVPEPGPERDQRNQHFRTPLWKGRERREWEDPARSGAGGAGLSEAVAFSTSDYVSQRPPRELGRRPLCVLRAGGS